MEDDLFQSLGGSLMKDLLADLQVDDSEGDGWLSLEQLEKELSQLDSNSNNETVSAVPATAFPSSLPLPPPPSAASMVVQGQQQQQSLVGQGLLGAVTVTTAPAADAWKESLQKFTASSFHQDFLAADTVRKQSQQAAPMLPPGFLADAQDYDATEKVTVGPPPGMGPPPGIAKQKQQQTAEPDPKQQEQQLKQALSMLPKEEQPRSDRLPKTPQNSRIDDEGAGAAAIPKPRPMPKTPQNSIAVGLKDEKMEHDVIPESQAVQRPAKKATPKTPRNSVMVGQPPQQQPPNPQAIAAAMSAQGMMMQPPPHPGMHPGMPMPGGMPPHMMPPPQMMGQVPVAMPAGGPAWQQQPPMMRPPPGPPPRPVFCNPHPNAPPIPASVLESRLMKSRDITYIVHSMMKPVLAAGISERDYDIQLLKRGGGPGPRPPPQPRPPRKKGGRNNNTTNQNGPDAVIQREMLSREQKSKQWSEKNAALGHFAKTNVARPRALIATPALTQEQKEDDERAGEQKQRARLWKARIYCDQAYQSYLMVVHVWAAAAPGTVPPQVHPPLIKLMKCMGAVPVQQQEGAGKFAGGEFKVDAAVLQLFLKLSKGRSLLARLLEQALLPPSAVQAILPVALEVMYAMPVPNKDQQQESNIDMTDDRLFHAFGNVIQMLPSLSGDVLLQSAAVMKANNDAALSSTGRMECLHAVLQRGSAMASSPAEGDAADTSSTFAKDWKETESEFMNILAGM